MSFQEQQQPGFVYPNTGISSSNPSPSSHSNGSFGAVFIVLAVIVVVSAIACFLSRLCSKRHKHNHRSPKQSHHEPKLPRPEKREPKQGHHGNFNDTGFGDIEIGFGKGFPNGKELGNGAKIKPHVTFDFRGDPRGVSGRELKDRDFNGM